MNPIDVRPQTRLSAARTFGLCLKGIRHRMFRSMLTTMVIVLAVAFFMNLLADSVMARSVDAGVREQVRLARRSAVAADLWFGRPSPTVLAARLASAGAPLGDYAAIAGWEPARLEALAAACRRERQVLDWLDGLDAGTRAILVRRARRDEVLAWLGGDAARWDAFAAEAARLRSHRPPLPVSALRAVVDSAAATAAGVEALAASWSRRIDDLGVELRTLTGADSRDGWLGWIAAADAAQQRMLAAALARHGFGGLYPEAAVAELREDFRLDRLRDAVVAALSTEEGRTRWLKAFRTTIPLDAKLLVLDDPRAAEVLAGRFDRADLGRIAASVAHERDLAKREANLAGKVDPDGGLVSVRQGFLVAISFVVCMVGIANAMLMAITERFREIATMKCLGATDGFILTQFLMEAGIQGAAGGAVGTVLGLLLSVIKGGWLFGGHLLWYFPWLGVLAAVVVCILAGLLLATLASVYPSWKASRMAPMEAMRVE